MRILFALFTSIGILPLLPPQPQAPPDIPETPRGTMSVASTLLLEGELDFRHLWL